MSSYKSAIGKIEAAPDAEADGEIITAALELPTPAAALKMIIGCTNVGEASALKIVGAHFAGWKSDVLAAA